MVLRASSKKLSAVGFEPTRIAPPELESGALDRSAKLTYKLYSDLRAQSFSARNVKILRGGIEPPTSCV